MPRSPSRFEDQRTAAERSPLSTSMADALSTASESVRSTVPSGGLVIVMVGGVLWLVIRMSAGGLCPASRLR